MNHPLLNPWTFLSDFDIFWPVIWLLLGAVLCIGIDISCKTRNGAMYAVFFAAIGGVLLALVSLLALWGDASIPRFALMNGIVVDRMGLILSVGICIGTALCCLSSVEMAERLKISLGDFLGLVLVAASGMVLLVCANDLIMVFLSIELLSLAVYVLAGMNHRSQRSAEAALKYFVMGGFASGFLLFGMALLYGLTGELQLGLIADQMQRLEPGMLPLALMAGVLMLIGFAFKVGAAPFHQWVPDVYMGAPTPVTGFMAVAVKIAAFGILARMILILFPQEASQGQLAEMGAEMLWVIAVLTILVGNWLAATQESIKRMLAYSSVAHSGYLLIGVLVAIQSGSAAEEGLSALVFYLIVYTFATGGAFAVLSYCVGEHEGDDVKDFRGLAWRRPWVAVAMTIFMMSLAGIPLTAGFNGKYFLFKSAIEHDQIWLAVLAIFGSMIGAFYYLRVVVYTYMKDPAADAQEPAGAGWGVHFALSMCALLTLYLGVLPGKTIEQSRTAVREMRDPEYRILGTPEPVPTTALVSKP